MCVCVFLCRYSSRRSTKFRVRTTTATTPRVRVHVYSKCQRFYHYHHERLHHHTTTTATTIIIMIFASTASRRYRRRRRRRRRRLIYELDTHTYEYSRAAVSSTTTNTLIVCHESVDVEQRYMRGERARARHAHRTRDGSGGACGARTHAL